MYFVFPEYFGVSRNYASWNFNKPVASTLCDILKRYNTRRDPSSLYHGTYLSLLSQSDLLPTTDTNVQLRKSYSLPSTLNTGSFIPLKKLTVPPLPPPRLSSCVPFPCCIRWLQAAQRDDVYLKTPGNFINKNKCV